MDVKPLVIVGTVVGVGGVAAFGWWLWQRRNTPAGELPGVRVITDAAKRLTGDAARDHRTAAMAYALSGGITTSYRSSP